MFSTSAISHGVVSERAQHVHHTLVSTLVAGQPRIRGLITSKVQIPSGLVLQPTQPPTKSVTGGSFWEQTGRSVKLTTHVHTLPRSRMSGAMPPLHVFMACIRTTLTLQQHDVHTQENPELSTSEHWYQYLWSPCTFHV